MNSTPIFHEPNFGLAACASSPTTLGNATVYTASVTGGTNVQHTWDFGDGQSGVGPAPSHFYTAAGSYTIVVTASNSLGEISTRLTVHVNPTAQVDEAITVLTISTQGSTVVGERVDVVTSSAGGSGVRYAGTLMMAPQVMGSRLSICMQRLATTWCGSRRPMA